jgi:hypothetical protein
MPVGPSERLGRMGRGRVGFLPQEGKGLLKMERENWNAQILDIWLDSHAVETIWIELTVARSFNTSS